MTRCEPKNSRPRIAMVMGDPAGIGPEIVGKLLADPDMLRRARILLIADPALAHGAGIALEGPDAPRLIAHPLPAGGVRVAEASEAGGRYAMATLRHGIDLIRNGQADALCFASLNKSALHMAGMHHPDELHWFAELLGHNGPISEFNVLDGLWTSRVTSHVPLMSVGALLTPERIAGAVELIHTALRHAGQHAPRIAVCGLNPHNGDNGSYGREEIEIIGPAVAQAQARGLPVEGPFPADTVFVRARGGAFDAVVTMYHDQGQIAMKLLGFDRGVTVAGGLPIPITTPAHGTAFDIVGHGVANHTALANAFHLACRLAQHRTADVASHVSP